MVPTNLVCVGKNSHVNQFEIYEKEHLIMKCPSGHKPIHSTFKAGFYRAHFDKKHCNDCPLRKGCSVIKQKKIYFFRYQRKPYTAASLSPRWEPQSINS